MALAGVRRSHTLSRGEHLFVDDLVTAEDVRGRGHGRAMLDWLGEQAAAEGIPRVYLDSRATAKGFYERAGFTFLTSIPCWRETPSSGSISEGNMRTILTLGSVLLAAGASAATFTVTSTSGFRPRSPRQAILMPMRMPALAHDLLRDPRRAASTRSLP